MYYKPEPIDGDIGRRFSLGRPAWGFQHRKRVRKATSAQLSSEIVMQQIIGEREKLIKPIDRWRKRRESQRTFTATADRVTFPVRD